MWLKCFAATCYWRLFSHDITALAPTVESVESDQTPVHGLKEGEYSGLYISNSSNASVSMDAPPHYDNQLFPQGTLRLEFWGHFHPF